MIHAYNKEYVSDAMENLGEAFDYAVHAQNLNLNKSEAIAKINMLLEDGSIIKIGNGRSVRYRLKISL